MYLKFTIMTVAVEYWRLYVVLWLELNRNYSIHLLLVSGTFCITCYETDLYHLNGVVPLPTIF